MIYCGVSIFRDQSSQTSAGRAKISPPQYSIALVYGARLINQGRTFLPKLVCSASQPTDATLFSLGADSGIVITVLFSIFIGSFSIMMMATQVNSVFKGQSIRGCVRLELQRLTSNAAFSAAMGAASKIYETIDRVPPIDSADEGGLKPSTCEGRLTFEGTSFHYPSRPGITVLSDFTASFPPGKTTALVGASGSGKTTIVSLLLRFYDPVTGSVKLDGHDLRDLNLKWLRQQIGESTHPLLPTFGSLTETHQLSLCRLCPARTRPFHAVCPNQHRVRSPRDLSRKRLARGKVTARQGRRHQVERARVRIPPSRRLRHSRRRRRTAAEWWPEAKDCYRSGDRVRSDNLAAG